MSQVFEGMYPTMSWYSSQSHYDNNYKFCLHYIYFIQLLDGLSLFEICKATDNRRIFLLEDFSFGCLEGVTSRARVLTTDIVRTPIG